MTINELREKRNRAWNAAKAFVETKRDKDGLLSDEDAATYAQMEKKVQDYGAEIERMKAMAAMEAQLSKPTSAPITEKPLNGKPAADEKPKTGRASDAYRAGMLTALRSNFHQVSDVLREGVDADGGYKQGLVTALAISNIYGYCKKDGEIAMNEDEAVIVRRIYKEFLDGKNYDEIIAGLTADGVPTRENATWHSRTVIGILSNEKYCGDCLFQKTFIPDPISHKTVVNCGEFLKSWWRIVFRPS